MRTPTRFARSRAPAISSSGWISRCCSAWASTQSRIICCSVRMWWTRPWMASARLAMAVVARLVEPRLVDRRRAAARWRRASRRSAPPARGRRIGRPMVVDRGREPVLELGVEAVLRLAVCRSRKPSTSEPARPNSEDENEMPMPPSGAARPSRSESNMRAGVAAGLEVDDAADRARRSRSGPRTCRAGRGTPAARSCSARCRAPRRGGWRSNRGCRASICAEIAMRPMRSPRIVAIGASSTGGRSTARPGRRGGSCSPRRSPGKAGSPGGTPAGCRSAARR